MTFVPAPEASLSHLLHENIEDRESSTCSLALLLRLGCIIGFDDVLDVFVDESTIFLFAALLTLEVFLFAELTAEATALLPLPLRLLAGVRPLLVVVVLTTLDVAWPLFVLYRRAATPFVASRSWVECGEDPGSGLGRGLLSRLTDRDRICRAALACVVMLSLRELASSLLCLRTVDLEATGDVLLRRLVPVAGDALLRLPRSSLESDLACRSLRPVPGDLDLLDF